ncbi:hypothetical protein [Pedobacter gandavensis]|uniref:hypothetical protein n=1 Tax=Pedobacter gandavensis TaxID=2679963 RepID=UPI00292F552B|nr:hypothetical protein [Pedobacter gandavensis]
MKSNSVQGENSIFFQQLDICCQKVAEKASQESIADWKNSDYVKLSGLLRRETKVNLSENTLKRIFGKLKTSTRYYPQKATRDALAQFIGYRDWYEFELLHPVTLEKPNLLNEPIEKPIPEELKKEKKKRYIPFLSVLILILLLTGGYFYAQSLDDGLITKVKLLCVNPNGQSPHSAIFQLQTSGVLPNATSSFSIDFADSKPRRSIFKDTLINHYYETPGRYFPVLYHHNKRIDTASVYLQSEGWSIISTMEHDSSRVYPILREEPAHVTNHYVSAKEVFNAGVDTSKTFFVSFAHVKPTNISADNFEFSANIKTSANRPGIRCSQTNIHIYAENDNHAFSIIRPECAAWNSFKFSEVQQDGGKTDLRALGHDLRKGGHLRLRIAQKNVYIYLDGREIFQTKYSKPIGKFMGIKIDFAGIGSFSDFKLQDLKTGEKF